MQTLRSIKPPEHQILLSKCAKALIEKAQSNKSIRLEPPNWEYIKTRKRVDHVEERYGLFGLKRRTIEKESFVPNPDIEKVLCGESFVFLRSKRSEKEYTNVNWEEGDYATLLTSSGRFVSVSYTVCFSRGRNGRSEYPTLRSISVLDQMDREANILLAAAVSQHLGKETFDKLQEQSA